MEWGEDRNVITIEKEAKKGTIRLLDETIALHEKERAKIDEIISKEKKEIVAFEKFELFLNKLLVFEEYLSKKIQKPGISVKLLRRDLNQLILFKETFDKIAREFETLEDEEIRKKESFTTFIIKTDNRISKLLSKADARLRKIERLRH